MFHEAEAIFIKDRGVLTDKLIEDGVIGLMVSKGHKQRTNYLRTKRNDYMTVCIFY